MKFSRTARTILWSAIAILAVGIALSIFIVASILHPERYRPEAESRLSQLLGRPVTIGKLASGWDGAFFLEASSVAIKDPSGVTDAVKAERIAVSLKLLPLLSRRFEIQGISLVRPELRLRRGPQGIGLEGAEEPSANADQAVGESPVQPVGLPNLSISSAKIESGSVFFTDSTRVPPLEVAVRSFDFSARGIRADEPFEFQTSAAVFSERPNVRAKGRARLAADGTPSLVSLEADADLGALPPDVFPKLAPQVTAHLRRAPKGRAFVSLADGTTAFRLENGELFPAALPAPLENVALKGEWDGDLRVERLAAQLGGGKIELSGASDGLATDEPHFKAQAKADRVPLEALLPPSPGGAAKIKGVLSGEVKLAALGHDLDTIKATAEGGGVLRLDEGVILDLNALATVVEKLSAIPGVGERLSARLPADLRQRMARPFTPLSPLEIPFTLRQGRASFDRVQILSDQFAFFARGAAGLDGGFSFEGTLVFEPRISQALIQSVNELSSIANDRGQIQVPVRVQRAPGGRVQFQPDLNYLGSRLGTQLVADQVLTRLIQKKSE